MKVSCTMSATSARRAPTRRATICQINGANSSYSASHASVLPSRSPRVISRSRCSSILEDNFRLGRQICRANSSIIDDQQPRTSLDKGRKRPERDRPDFRGELRENGTVSLKGYQTVWRIIAGFAGRARQATSYSPSLSKHYRRGRRKTS